MKPEKSTSILDIECLSPVLQDRSPLFLLPIHEKCEINESHGPRPILRLTPVTRAFKTLNLKVLAQE